MEAKLVWKRSGKTIVGIAEVEITDLSHLALPTVATFRERRHGHPPPMRRTWRGDAHNGVYIKVEGPLHSAWREHRDGNRYNKTEGSLARQLSDLLGHHSPDSSELTRGSQIDRVTLPGLDLITEERSAKSPLKRVEGDEAILANGGREALDFARWSASLYALMDGALWRRHPGPWFHLRLGVSEANVLTWVSDSRVDPYSIDVRRATEWEAFANAGPDPRRIIELEIHSREALDAFDSEALLLERVVRNIRHQGGLRRVADLDPKALRTIAALARVDEAHPIAALRGGSPTEWPYDRRRFDFPFRPELVQPMRDLYELVKPQMFSGYLMDLDSAFERLETRVAALASVAELSAEDREALDGLPVL